MRTYTASLVFENCLEVVPETQLTRSTFNPHVQVSESDCNTLLGERIELTFESEGKVEVATGLPLTRGRVTYLLSQGQYSVRIRTTGSCQATGVCQKCYSASNPDMSVPNIGDMVNIPSRFEKSTERHLLTLDTEDLVVSLPPTQYSTMLVFSEGNYLPKSDYSVEGTTISFVQAIPAGKALTVRFLVATRNPFLQYLARCYAGSLLGIKNLPSYPLPLPPKKISSQLQVGELEELITQITHSKLVPDPIKQYLSSGFSSQGSNLLEKTLLSLAAQGVFLVK